jgi:hypothetical protein
MNAPASPVLPVGIFSDIPMERYLADPCAAPSVSSGCVHTLLTRSPFHAWADHPKNPHRIPGDESTDMDIGTLAHALLLEKSEERAAVIDPHEYPGLRGGIPKGWTNDAIRAARDQARAAGRVPILLADMERVRAMRDAALEYIAKSEIADVFDEGEAETTVIAQEGDVWLRARPDWITNDRSFHVSFKTTPGSAEPMSFVRYRMSSLGYDTALRFYARAIAGATGHEPASCILIQESQPPYRCAMVGLAPALADLCDRKVSRAIEIFGDCLKRGRWPEYPHRICYADPMPWQEAQFEERQAIDPLQEKEGLQI